MEIKYFGREAAEIRRKLKAGIKASGKKQYEIAARLNTTPPTISRVLSGGAKDSIEVSNQWVVRIAEIIGRDPRDFLPAAPRFRPLRIRGVVQAGAFSESSEWPDDEMTEFPMPDLPQFRGIALFGAEVRGPSMNLIYPEGTILAVATLHDLGESLLVGKRYVIERILADGVRERTVKTLWRDDDGKLWMIPESSDRRFGEALPVEAGDGETIEIKGRVVWAARPE